MRSLFPFALSTLLLSALTSCLPPTDPYPFIPPNELRAEAKAISDGLEAHIRAWTTGNASAEIPAALIPTGITDSKNFYLKSPAEVTPEETWAVRYARPVNKDSLLAGIPEPKATYLFLGTALAPFGSKLVIEGEFPHARFFSFQISAPFDGESYYAERQFGAAEVSLVDADIEPLPGHVNPYRLGADRDAENRSYRVEFDLTLGDPVAANGGAFAYPYRGGGNRRAGALLVHQGPLSEKTIIQQARPAAQPWNLGVLWVRIYHPDDGTGPLGGVAMPRVHYELPNGERYFIGSDFTALRERADATVANQDKVFAPNPNFGPAVGWQKSWGIARSILTGVSVSNGWERIDSARRVADVHLGWTGRGEFQGAPHDYEPHATTNNYANYLGRKVDIPRGDVLVLTGKMPTFPATRNGEQQMAGGQVRFWSMIGIDDDPLSPLAATTIHAVNDDEVVLSDKREYIICYSRPEDRPANATEANGVTWVNSGTQTQHGLLLRWVSVREGWFTPTGPGEDTLTWAVADWAGSAYDSTRIGVNNWQGHMGCFLPRVHTLGRENFEALGSDLAVEDVPVWLDRTYTNGPTFARFATATASSILNDGNGPGNATDGNVGTTWSNAFGSGQDTITLQLDSLRHVSAVRLLWNAIFFGRDYELSSSVDGLSWVDMKRIENGGNGAQIIRGFASRNARFVRLIITRSSSTWSSLAEFEVYGANCVCPVAEPNNLGGAAGAVEIHLKVWPNPTARLVNFSARRRVSTLRVFAADGRLVQEHKQPRENVDLALFGKGIFLLEFQGNGWRESRRVVVR